MKYAEIWPHVVDGFKVTCERFGEGTFVDYQFNGLRINHKGGSSSGYTATEADMAVEWSIVPDEPIAATPAPPPKPFDDVLVLDGGKWGKPTPAPAPAPPNVGKWGKPLPSPGKWGKGS